nr:unnamed protein product [Spirometra erinaceieuropaei]
MQTIVHPLKCKGNQQLCDNDRGVSLFNIVGKIFARILISRPNGHFCWKASVAFDDTGHHRHSACYLPVKKQCQKMQTHLYTTSLDLTKAFDTVNCEGLRKILQKFGCPERFTRTVRQLYEGLMTLVTDNGDLQGICGDQLSEAGLPTIFSLSAMLGDAYRYERLGIRITYRIGGHQAHEGHNAPIYDHHPQPAFRRRFRAPHHDQKRRVMELAPPLLNHGQDGGHAPAVIQHATQHYSSNQC